MLGQRRERVAGARRARRRAPAPAPCPLSWRRRAPPPPRRTARSGRTRTRGDRCAASDAAAAACRSAGRGPGHDLGQRAADLAEAEQHDVACAPRGSRRRRRSSTAGRRRGPPAARPPRPWPPTTNEMFSSDDPWAMATMLISASASAANTRAAMPRWPAMPIPTTATVASPARALDAVDLARGRSRRGTPRSADRAPAGRRLGDREADRLLRRRLRDQRDR